MELKFGKFKGHTIEEVAVMDGGASWLQWCAKNTDPNDPKFGKNNKALIAEISRVLQSSGSQVSKSTKPTSQAPSMASNAVLDKLAKIERMLTWIIGKISQPEKQAEKVIDFSKPEYSADPEVNNEEVPF